MEKQVNVTIIGTGAYGTVLANVLADNGHNVLMYGVVEKQINNINEDNKNSEFFGDLALNKNIKATDDFAYAMEKAEIIFLCVPTFALKKVLSDLNQYGKRKMYIINTAKGLDEENEDLLSRKIKKLIEPRILKSFGAVYGPSVAIEVIEKKPTCIMSCNENIEDAKFIANILHNEYFVTIPTDDLVSCELSAALKNTVAIGAGILGGILNSDNSNASFLTMGINEIEIIASKFGGKDRSFLNYATLGDLILTASSKKSRNYSLGVEIASSGDAKKVLEKHTKTVEGVTTAKIAYEIIKKNQLNCPLFEKVYEILYNNSNPNVLLDCFK